MASFTNYLTRRDIYNVRRFRFGLPLFELWNLNIETKGYMNTKDTRDEVHKKHSRIQYIRAQKNWGFSEELKVDLVEMKLAQYE
jgi:hypothetical protein